ncbi:MAG: tRNA preQ1(34) S-adenosylmethionine ribosyltransferase-isomerase QueA [Acidimicrobiales bacterium]
MDRNEFGYELPETAIAQRPFEPRDGARLLVDRGPQRSPRHGFVSDLPELLSPGDLLVVNDTRVRPARLQLHKETGAAVEILLLEARPGDEWDALVRPARRVRPGMTLRGPGVRVTVVEDLGEGRRRVAVTGDAAAVGEIPLPPYIRGTLDDPERYQTVYARRPGSVAAPTAGLHLTHEVLERCRRQGIDVAPLELDVGLDTFRPITAPHLDDHEMHSEAYNVPADTLAACDAAHAGGGRVIAVGTTVVRALEAAAASGQREGRTNLFIRRGYRFRLVDGLLTNFHLPRTTLLVLVDAFIGPRWRDLYTAALAEGYRFLSFGDAMLLERRP